MKNAWAPGEAETLQRNDAWLMQVVEAFGLCPFARTCRTEDRLLREVVPQSDWQPVVQERLLALQQTTDGDFEVGLVLVPQASRDPREFERQVRQLADLTQTQLAKQGVVAACHVVAFHPLMPFVPTTAAGLTGLWRRSPDPTLQLVRKSVLDTLRERQAPLRFVDVGQVGDLQQWLQAHREEARQGLSARIAATNAQTFALDGQQIAALLAKLALPTAGRDEAEPFAEAP
jgi:hypothetical protein